MNGDNSIGQKILQARKDAGLKQKELAERLGLTPTALNYYEKGKRMPSIEILKKVSNILGISMDYLLGLESPKAQPVKDALTASKPAEAARQLGLPEGSLLPIGDVLVLDSGEAVPYLSRSSSPNAAGLSYEDIALLLSRRKTKAPSSSRLGNTAQLLRLATSASDQELEKLLGLAQVLLGSGS